MMDAVFVLVLLGVLHFSPQPCAGVAKGASCEGKPSSCITGSECDLTTKTCRMMLGQICSKDMDCVTNSICDIDGTCKIALNEICEANSPYCMSDTFCDKLNTCKYGTGHECNKTEQCVAGAVCTADSRCVCWRAVSMMYGAICEPNEGRIGSDCDEVKECDVTLGGTCGTTLKCECPEGTPVLHDFRCDGFDGEKDVGSIANKSALKNLAHTLAAVFGGLCLLACVGFVVSLVGRRNNKAKKDLLMEERMASMKELQALTKILENELGNKDSHVKVNLGETSSGRQDIAPQQLGLKSPGVRTE